MVYEEQDDFVDPLMQLPQAVDRGDKGEDKDEVELPYSTLYQMQLDREDQSHQEACEKYGKVRMVPANVRGACKMQAGGDRRGGSSCTFVLRAFHLKRDENTTKTCTI